MNDLIDIAYVQRAESRHEYGIRDIAISHKNFTDVMVREIDSRPAAELTSTDTDWGEQDNLANIPRRTREPWLRVLLMGDADE